MYLIYLFISNVFFSESDIENLENTETNNSFKFLRIVALLSLTDFAFSIDSITTAVAISDQYILIIFGALIGVLALRFTSGLFLSLLDNFSRLEKSGSTTSVILSKSICISNS